MAELDPKTLKSIARTVAYSERVWRGNMRPTYTYGAGFAYGMAEMARRVKVHCRDRAKAIERKRKAKERR